MNADPDTDLVLAALSRLGADHEPDVPALRRHIDRRQRPSAAARWKARSVLLPAAAVLLAGGGGVVLIASIGGSGPDPAVRPSPTSAGISPISPPSAPFGPAPTSSGTSTPAGTAASSPGPGPGPGPSGTAGTAASGPPAPAVRPTQAGPLASADIMAVSASSPTSLQLNTSVMLDWLAVGARDDVTVVRAKSAAAEPVLTFDQPPGVTAVPGPFRVSWTGGLPEQSHTAATTWLRRPGTAGLSVSVAPSPHPRTVMLAAGASGLAATVQVSGGAVLAPVSLGDASSPAPPAVLITVRLPSTTSVAVIHLGGDATGGSAGVFLSAVAIVAD